MFKSVGLVSRYDKPQALKLSDTLAEYLAQKGLKVYIDDSLAGSITSKEQFIPLADMQTDFIITIGGDGTILRAAITAPKPETPLLTINMGVRGFLTEIEPQDAFTAVDRILKGDYHIEKSTKMAVCAGKETLPDALNDVVISTGEPSKILYAEICKNGKPLLKCQADGLIVSTQTGSTGYSLSAGGPVLDPEVDAFVLTPICSLTVFHSLVFPADSILTFNVLKEKMLLLIDGNYRKQISTDELTVKVTKSKNVTSFIRFETSFYDRLRNRLFFKGTE
ncbi:MAG: NAD(+)/NADH kinase [Nitrososphaerota archaeon]|jgi:NAD+ kinase|uniref:NAD(+)/NADH kinase n=1 Tax=Candidatus Bathycorpusculum sp. TaxID=2994959 RepID=UPI00282423DA|nr:NAD(+)/NADH kinase [Candidatus Termitimicrobium sp.]MCL2431373.1 NAD(+)/NADH kinase [Candidatus Termitimicrobium sp.]MDR0492075.1 NAD(+)/NADH kinase [Nitrososphaerota archaeon]